MAVQQGMDTDRVREIADQLRAERAKVDQVLGKGRASAGVLRGSWGGDDLLALLDRWDGEAARRLGEASQAVGAAADLMSQQASDQDAASGEVGGGSGRPGGAGGPGQGQDPMGGTTPGGGGGGDASYSVTDRDRDALGVRTNKGPDGNLHHYDPLTGKTWVEDAEGRWVNASDPTGHSSLTTTDTTEHGNGWETTRESTRGEGGGRTEYGESWGRERDFDDSIGSRAQDVLDGVNSEPFVETRAEASARADWLSGEVGDESLGASGSLGSADASAEASAGVDATRGAYAEASAQAGAYLARGEVHASNDVGTAAEASAYLGAQGEASAGGQIGPGGASVEAGVEAFAGGKVEGGVSQDIGDYGNVGVSGSLSYGIGAEADVEAEASWDRIGFSGEVGLTLGVGGSIDLDLSISPKAIVSSLNPFD